MEPTPPTSKNNLLIPIAIVIAGALIAGTLYLTSGTPGADASQPASDAENLEAVAPVTGADHIRGDKDAPVTIIEYSDTECPFCKAFHPTLQRLVDEGEVAWVYRHFPLDQLHPKADKEAEATECANELGGNDAFWAYLDRLFVVTPSNNALDPAELPKIAEYVGLDVVEFSECLAGGKYAQHVEDDTQNAIATGGSGTPWSIVVTKAGKKYPLSGAQPYEAVKQLLDEARE